MIRSFASFTRFRTLSPSPIWRQAVRADGVSCYPRLPSVFSRTSGTWLLQLPVSALNLPPMTILTVRLNGDAANWTTACQLLNHTE